MVEPDDDVHPDWALRPMAGWAEFQEGRRRFLAAVRGGAAPAAEPPPSSPVDASSRAARVRTNVLHKEHELCVQSDRRSAGSS